MNLGELQDAGIKHLLWKKQVRAVIDGRSPAADLGGVSHKNSEFGKWLYSGILDDSTILREAKELETLHIEAHMIAGRIVHLKDNDNAASAEDEYKKLEEISKKIIGLLTVLGRTAQKKQ